MTAKSGHPGPGQLTIIDGPGAGPVEIAARTMLGGMLERGELEPGLDDLMVAHVVALAARLDSPRERAYGLAHISRELREVYAILAERRKATEPAEADPLLALLADDA